MSQSQGVKNIEDEIDSFKKIQHQKDSLARVAFIKDSLERVQVKKDSLTKVEYEKDSLARVEFKKDSLGKVEFKKDSLARVKYKKRLAIAKYKKDNINALAREKYKEGVALYKTGKYDSAIESLTSALQLDPAYYAVHYRGACHQQLEQYANAINDYKSAIRCDPTDVYSNINMARIFLLQNNYSDAILHFTNVIEIEIKDKPSRFVSESYYLRGYCKKKLKLAHCDDIITGISLGYEPDVEYVVPTPCN